DSRATSPLLEVFNNAIESNMSSPLCPQLRQLRIIVNAAHRPPSAITAFPGRALEWLEVYHTSGEHRMVNEVIQDLSAVVPQVKRLDIRTQAPVDCDVDYSSFTSLKQFRHKGFLSSKSWDSLACCPDLTSLSIDHDYSVMHWGTPGCSLVSFPSLQSLDLSRVVDARFASTTILRTTMPNLRELKLSLCGRGANEDRVITSLAELGPLLRKLHIRFQGSFKYERLCSFGAMQDLQIVQEGRGGSFDLQDQQVEHLSRCMPLLESLVISTDATKIGITPDSLVHLARNCTLRHLDIVMDASAFLQNQHLFDEPFTRLKTLRFGRLEIGGGNCVRPFASFLAKMCPKVTQLRTCTQSRACGILSTPAILGASSRGEVGSLFVEYRRQARIQATSNLAHLFSTSKLTMGDTSTTSPPLAPSASEQETSNMLIPEGFRLHTENSASILLPDTADAFLNPVQEFNRDLSVACIRVWGDDMNAKRKEKWENKAQNRGKGKGKRAAGPDALDDVGLAKKLKGQSGEAVEVEAKSSSASQHHDEMIVEEQIQVAEEVKPDTIALEDFRPQKFVILEALSATGLRSIRYAKEIPLVKYVIANDLDPAATAAIRRNVGLNGLGPQPQTTESETGDDIATTDQALSTRKPPPADLGKVQINEGDACDLMYSHRPEHHRVDVVDLDPYGTAAPFIDAAVQCVKEDGNPTSSYMINLSVLASGNFPEKCFSNYGGVSMKAEYCHEAALRLVLHTISTSAARYGRYITPLLS
ncbi:RNA methyltransferase tRNA(m5U54)methyltransferase, partial [Tulasnella sp. 403]